MPHSVAPAVQRVQPPPDHGGVGRRPAGALSLSPSTPSLSASPPSFPLLFHFPLYLLSTFLYLSLHIFHYLSLHFSTFNYPSLSNFIPFTTSLYPSLFFSTFHYLSLPLTTFHYLSLPPTPFHYLSLPLTPVDPASLIPPNSVLLHVTIHSGRRSRTSSYPQRWVVLATPRSPSSTTAFSACRTRRLR